MNMVVYRIGELVASFGGAVACLIIAIGFYWILRSKLNPSGITKKNLTKAMAWAYEDIFNEELVTWPLAWDHPKQQRLHTALLDGRFDPQTFQFNCMIVCDWLDGFNQWETGTTYNMWMTKFIQHIQV